MSQVSTVRGYRIGGAGIVRLVQADPDYRYRPEPETTLDALRKVVGR